MADSLKGRCVAEMAWFTGIDLVLEVPASRALDVRRRLSSDVELDAELTDAGGALSAPFAVAALGLVKGLVAAVRDRLRVFTVF